jgi:hypothetical protein
VNPVRIAGVVVMILGALGLLYGTFSYTKATHRARIAGLELAVDEKETVNVPVWAGVAALVAGGLLVIVPRRR